MDTDDADLIGLVYMEKYSAAEDCLLKDEGGLSELKMSAESKGKKIPSAMSLKRKRALSVAPLAASLESWMQAPVLRRMSVRPTRRSSLFASQSILCALPPLETRSSRRTTEIRRNCGGCNPAELTCQGQLPKNLQTKYEASAKGCYRVETAAPSISRYQSSARKRAVRPIEVPKVIFIPDPCENGAENDSSTDIVECEENAECEPRKPRSHKFIIDHDLSKDEELFPVRVWNDIDTKTVPEFEYIVTIEDMDGYKRTPCVCQCLEACDGKCHCMAEPFEPNRCEIAYEVDTGLLKKPRDWLTSVTPTIPRFIWECSTGCPCGQECPNRSAQLGLRYPFEVFLTAGKGWGVRCLRDLPAGAFVAEYTGEMKMEDGQGADLWSESAWYTFNLLSVTGKSKSYLDASKKGNIARFINHGCSPNVVAIHVFYDDINLDHGMHVGIYTVRKIKAFQELVLDYGEAFWKAKNEAGQYCKCGSSVCYYKAPINESGKKVRRKARRK